jgi:GMP synthase (glutamine-hydrolysing)
MKIHYFQHVPFEELGTIKEWVDSKKHTLTCTQFFKNTSLPDLDGIDWLIVMGGPMGVYDERTLPWLSSEKQFIAEAMRQKKKVLGICLGAQLIASSLGAKVYPNSQKEIGWFPVSLTKDGLSSKFFKHLPEQFTAFHWHGDTFDLPEGSQLLISNSACKHQAFSFGDSVLGLQFHVEVKAENVASLVQHCGDELQDAPWIQSADVILKTHNHFESLKTMMYHILDSFAR